MFTLENGSPSRQLVSVLPLMEFQNQGSKFESIAQSMDDLDIESLLMLQALVKNGRMYAKDFEETIRLTRAPVQLRLRHLTEIKLVDREIDPRTESKYRPTYIYTAAAWLSEDLLALKLSSKSKPAGKPQTQKQDQVIQEPQQMSHAISERENQAQIMAELLEIAIDRIADLEERLGRLEHQNNASISLDRDELLRKLRGKKS